MPLQYTLFSQAVKTENFEMKVFNILNIFAQNID